MIKSLDDLIRHDAHGVRITRDGPQGQPVYQHRFQVAFKESASLSRNVYFTHFISWIGKIRELPMEEMANPLLQDFLTGQWGMVTNSTSLQILGEATSYDVIQARAWVGEVVGSSFDTHLEFTKVRPDQSIEPLAWGKVRATWVQLVRYGVPSPRAFPGYVQQYLDLFAPQREGPNDPAPVSAPLTQIDRGPLVYQKPPGIGRGKDLWAETFPTTLEEANLVGNVYYGNYFIWQGRVRDMFLYSCVPQLLRTSKSTQELVCLSTRMDYLREAMPFDRIQAVMSVESAYRCGATLNFEFFRTYPDGKKEKLSVGRQEVAWVEREADGTPRPAAWPESVVTALAQPNADSMPGMPPVATAPLATAHSA